jgi:hypothetical protein
MRKRITPIIAGAVIAGAVAVVAFGVGGNAGAKPVLVATSVQSSSTGAQPQHGGPGKNVDAVASVLGLTASELRTQIDAGKTLAQVATAQGVDVQKVIDTIVSEMKAHLAVEVASGEHTQAEVDAKLAELDARVTEMVNKVRPAHPANGRGGRHGHEGGRGEMRGPRMEGTTAPSTNS